MFRLLPLISLFPPATLSVALDIHHDQITHPIRLPGLFNQSIPLGQYSEINVGDLPILELEQDIFSSNAVNGEIKRPLDLNFGSKTYSNYSYSASMHLPRLRCATESVSELDAPLRNATVTWLGKFSICEGCPTCISSMDPATWSLYANCTNQVLQMHGLYLGLTYNNDHVFPRDDIVPSLPAFANSDGNIIIILASNSSHATVSNCTAVNSTVDFTVRYINGIPTITTNSIVDHGTYWVYDESGDFTNIMDYTAVSRWVNGIFGWMGGYKSFYTSVTGSSSSYYTSGSVQGTVLRFAKDFYEVDKAMNLASGPVTLPEPGQVRDMTMVRMLEQLSLNISLSYMSQDLLRYVLYTGLAGYLNDLDGC